MGHKEVYDHWVIDEKHYDLLFAVRMLIRGFHTSWHEQETDRGLVSRGYTKLTGNLHLKYHHSSCTLVLSGAVEKQNVFNEIDRKVLKY